MDRAADSTIRVTLACSPGPREVVWCELLLPADACAADAVRAGAPQVGCELGPIDALALGIWGRPCEATQPLRDGDRLEVYRPLLADPKDTRRRRQQLQKGQSGKGSNRAARRGRSV